MNVQLKVGQLGKPVPIKVWKFPAGEIGVKIEDIEAVKQARNIYVMLNDASSDSIMVAINLANAVKHIRKDLPNVGVHLIAKYLPYSRQDRICHEGESFALDVFFGMLAPHFSWIFTLDVHSHVSKLLAEKHKVVFTDLGQATCADRLPAFDYFVAPDAGASHKIDQHYAVEFGDTKVVQLSKTRKDGKVVYDDLKSGTLSGKVCVVDDLADGAATFLSLGQMLRRTQPNVTELSLYVTHGLFTNNSAFVELNDLYDTVYVHNMMNEKFKPYVKEI